MVIRESVDTDKANARVAQLVERDLAKVEAAGSSPVSRSFKKCGNADKHSVSVFFGLFQKLLAFLPDNAIIIAMEA